VTRRAIQSSAPLNELLTAVETQRQRKKLSYYQGYIKKLIMM